MLKSFDVKVKKQVSMRRTNIILRGNTEYKMNRILKYTIKESDNGTTVGDFLKRHGYSHPIIVHLKKTENGILLNGKWSYVRSVLTTSDLLEIRLIESQSSENIPPTEISDEDFRKMTVYEDEDILLVNKPAGLPVHPSLGHYEDTLANYCAYHYLHNNTTCYNGTNYNNDSNNNVYNNDTCNNDTYNKSTSIYEHSEKSAQLSETSDTNFIFRCVNRLDRDTSGLVLIAKNMLSSCILSNEQLSRNIHRTYLAIAEGSTPSSGTITYPIARKAESIIERCVDMEHGDSAVTHYETLDTKNGYSLVKIQLETGRTHQIRVHMKAIGHPLPGDFLYNPDFTHIKRQALHSYRLEFTHPITGESLSFIQNPPEDFFFENWKL